MREDIANLPSLRSSTTPFSPPAEAIGRIGANSTSTRSSASKADALHARAMAALADEFGDVGFGGPEGPAHVPAHAVLASGCSTRPNGQSERFCRSGRRSKSAGRSNRRDGLSPAYGCLLWLRHVLTPRPKLAAWPALSSTGLNFSATAARRWREANEQLGVAWPYWSESALADIDRFVSTDLRHQRASEEDLRAHPAVNDLVRRTYAAMMDLVRDPGRQPRLENSLTICARVLETASAIFDMPMREVAERGASSPIASRRRHRARQRHHGSRQVEKPRFDEERVSFLLETALKSELRRRQGS